MFYLISSAFSITSDLSFVNFVPLLTDEASCTSFTGISNLSDVVNIDITSLSDTPNKLCILSFFPRSITLLPALFL